MIVVQYLADRNVLTVSGIPAPFPAGSLQARRLGDLLAVASPHDGTLICAWIRFDLWARGDGTGFADPDEAFAYLDATCSRVPARVPAMLGVAAEAILQGMPLAVGRADSRLRTARADTYPLAFVVGLAEADTATGFAGSGLRTAVTRADWTAITGTPALVLGQPYFLAPAGGLTLQPDRTPGIGLSLTRVGSALAPDTLAFAPSDPILL